LFGAMSASEHGGDGVGGPLRTEASGLASEPSLLTSELSFDDVPEQRFHVPLKMRSANARDAVELLLRLSDGDPVTVVVSIAEHLCQKFRGRFPNAEVLLKRILQLRASDNKGLEVAKRAKRIATANRANSPTSVYQRSATPGVGGGSSSSYGNSSERMRARTAPSKHRPPLSASGANSLESTPMRGHNHSVASQPSNRANHDIGSVLPSEGQDISKPMTAPAKAKRADYVQLPPLETNIMAEFAQWQKSDVHIKHWMMEKKRKEKKRSDARSAMAAKDRKWLAQLAEKQTTRNKLRRIEEERNEAATRIQGAYRGMADRRIVKTIKADRQRQEEEKRKAQETEEGRLEEDMERLFS